VTYTGGRDANFITADIDGTGDRLDPWNALLAKNMRSNPPMRCGKLQIPQ